MTLHVYGDVFPAVACNAYLDGISISMCYYAESFLSLSSDSRKGVVTFPNHCSVGIVEQCLRSACEHTWRATCIPRKVVAKSCLNPTQ